MHMYVCVIAEELFIKLDRARQILMDKEKRSKYDLWRTGGFKNVLSFEKWFEMQNRVHAVSDQRECTCVQMHSVVLFNRVKVECE